MSCYLCEPGSAVRICKDCARAHSIDPSPPPEVPPPSTDGEAADAPVEPVAAFDGWVYVQWRDGVRSKTRAIEPIAPGTLIKAYPDGRVARVLSGEVVADWQMGRVISEDVALSDLD